MSAIATRKRSHSAPISPSISVLRALPLVGLKSIGPFVFLDHAGPLDPPHKGVPAHPHAGIEVITYLIEGVNEHRDSFGNHGLVKSGGVQWITSGRGMLHAEDPGDAVLELVQFWARHPSALDDQPPRYQAVQASEILETKRDGARLRLISGALPGFFDQAGPVRLSQSSLLVHVTLSAGATVTLPLPNGEEVGVYVLHGDGRIGDDAIAAGEIALLNAAKEIRLSVGATASFDLMLLGGAPAEQPLIFDGPFVLGSREAMAKAKADYAAGRMGSLDGAPSSGSRN